MFMGMGLLRPPIFAIIIPSQLHQAADEGDVAAAWSESERLLQHRGVYGEDGASAFPRAVLEAAKAQAKAKSLYLLHGQKRRESPAAPEPEAQQLHFVAECTEEQLAGVKASLTEALENFHAQVVDRRAGLVAEPPLGQAVPPRVVPPKVVPGAQPEREQASRPPWTGPPTGQHGSGPFGRGPPPGGKGSAPGKGAAAGWGPQPPGKGLPPWGGQVGAAGSSSAPASKARPYRPPWADERTQDRTKWRLSSGTASFLASSFVWVPVIASAILWCPSLFMIALRLGTR